jgi:hypothetical protein
MLSSGRDSFAARRPADQRGAGEACDDREWAVAMRHFCLSISRFDDIVDPLAAARASGGSIPPTFTPARHNVNVCYWQAINKNVHPSREKVANSGPSVVPALL